MNTGSRQPISRLSIGYLEVVPGINLRYAQGRTPIDPALGTVVLLQGRSEFLEKYLEVAGELLDLGYHVVTFDWRGQGLSTRLTENRQRGHIDSYDSFLEDLSAILANLVRPAGDGPAYALAHSMGGHILLRYLDSEPDVFDAAVLSAPMVDIAGNTFQRFGLLALSFLAVRCGFGRHYALGMHDYQEEDRDFGKNRRTHDPARFAREVRALADNPDLILGGVTWGWLYATLVSVFRLRRTQPGNTPRRPVLINSAGEEKIVSNCAQQEFCARRPRCTLRTIDHAYHEILQERDPIRQEFWRNFREFLQSAAGRQA